MKLSTFLNKRRLHEYPYLFLGTMLVIFILNIILHQGWIGGTGNVLGTDFITLYAAGLINRTNPEQLYDFNAQRAMQETLIAPTPLPGLNPFISPPYVAFAYSFLTYLPLPWSLALWSGLTLIFVFLAMLCITQYFPRIDGLNRRQLIVVSLSFMPFFVGFQAGQNHAITLVLVTGILAAAFREKWFLAGTLAGGLIYKPQLAIGLLIVWLVWRNTKALMGFVTIALVWICPYVIIHGFDPMRTYFEISKELLLLPFIEGFPGYLLTTLHGLVSSVMLASTAETINLLSQAVFVLVGGFLGWCAYQQRKQANSPQIPIVVLAVITPLAFSPYVQFHDLLLLVPAFTAWGVYDRSQPILWAAVVTYLGAFLLLPLSALTGIAWVAILPIGLCLAAFWRMHGKNSRMTWEQGIQ
ncbi:MAG TPA: glycosyltransferase family 87 protein [Anaerolineales bacterium]|nr:glycosyltransferase family 87 protein [Anaerolineales bacterium]